MEAKLRQANSDDEASVCALVNEAFQEYIPLIGRTPLPMLADHRDLIQNHDTWVLEQNSCIVGVLEMIHKSDSLYIDTVAVSKSYQGQGLGRKLLLFAETRALELEFKAITLLTNERYIHLLEMYNRVGYVETHREPYQGTDIVHLYKKLEHGKAIT